MTGRALLKYSNRWYMVMMISGDANPSTRDAFFKSLKIN
jgi:hypothetical protein